MQYRAAERLIYRPPSDVISNWDSKRAGFDEPRMLRKPKWRGLPVDGFRAATLYPFAVGSFAIGGWRNLDRSDTRTGGRSSLDLQLQRNRLADLADVGLAKDHRRAG